MFGIFVVACVVVISPCQPTSFQEENPYQVLSVRSSFTSDFVDGTLNYAKLLFDERQLEFLELTDEQRKQIQYLARRYFEIRAEQHETSGKGHLSPIFTEPFDLESVFGGILLPHQVEILNSSMYLKFLLETRVARASQPENVRKWQERFEVLRIAKMLGIDSGEAKKTADQRHLAERYQQVLLDSIEKLREVEKRQNEEVLRVLPDEWRIRLARK